jgi:hypothetical protein
MDKILKTFLKATEKEYEEGIKWYPNAYNFALSLNSDVRKSAGVIAALSPRQKWEINKRGAEKIMKAVNNHSSVIPSVGGTYINVDKAWRIANGENPEEVLKSSNPKRYYKVRRFYENILGNKDLVTIDYLTAVAAFDNPPSFVGGKLYLETEKRFQKIAKSLKIPPRELQAICWLVERNEKEATTRNDLQD